MARSARTVSGDMAGASLPPAPLLALVGELAALSGEGPIAPDALDAVLRRHPKEGRGFYSKREILRAFRATPERWPVPEAFFAERLRTTPTRSHSGVLPVTVLTKPFPCPGQCVFCPDDVRMPKSYLRDEPGCQRALQHDFDPYDQVRARLTAYRDMGHPTDKVELIVLGGTWSSYPERYQRWFVARLFEALNDFPREPGPRDREERADWSRVEAAQGENEEAASRCVGLSLETRPDHVTPEEVLRLRRLGATKIQLGLQSLDDAVLAANRRGHDVAASRAAMGRLRAAGFKLHVHWMPNLVGATPESDRRDFARLWDDPAFRPDELKVYPCSLLETAELMDVHRRGGWAPYGTEELVELLADVLPTVPAWCRVTRVIRDIPSPEIVVGNRQTNLRETVEARILDRGGRLLEIRAREVRGAPATGRFALHGRTYEASGGRELFLEATTEEGGLLGFARCWLPSAGHRAPSPELEGVGLLREVHVYGPAAALSERTPGRPQHRGLGSALVARALEEVAAAGFTGLAVISAVGTRAWYRRLGFHETGLYQTRSTAA